MSGRRSSPSSPRRFPAAWRTLADLVLLAVLECFWCWPLPLRLGSAIPGDGPGDNLSFLWNFWWARKALATPGLHLLDTGYLFYPAHVDLALNTNTQLNAVVGATVLAPLSTITTLNVTILAGFVLAAIGAYLLARDLTGSRRAAILAGIIFGQSPYLAAHLLGHFNLTSAWVLPWFLFAFGRMLDRHSRAAAAGAGLLLVATAYTDYYYLVFAAIAAGAWLAIRCVQARVTVQRRVRSRGRALTLVMLCTVLLVDAAIATGILLSGGGRLRIGRATLSMTGTFNLREMGWVLVLALVLVIWRVRVRVQRLPIDSRLAGLLAIVAGVTALGLTPLVLHAADLWRHGDYVSQAYGWRSAPSGVDLLTFVAGNLFHPVWGRWSMAIYSRFQLNPVEDVAWLGIVPVVCAWIGWRRAGGGEARRRWSVLFAIFFIWALGPFLQVAGANTGLVLPEMFIRVLPIVANARIPGRAIVVVYLALAMFAALGLASLRGRWSGPVWQWALVGLVAFGFLRAPLPMYEPKPSPIAATIAASQTPGAVISLPLGLADGFGERGRFDRINLYLQMRHQRPLAGGFIARLSPRVLDAYARLPVVGAWWQMSEGKPLPDPDVPRGQAAAAALRREGFAFVVLDTSAASPALIESVRSLGLPRVMADGRRELYEVSPSARARAHALRTDDPTGF